MAELLNGDHRPPWTPDIFAEFQSIAQRARGGDKAAGREAARFVAVNGVPDWNEICAERVRRVAKKPAA